MNKGTILHIEDEKGYRDFLRPRLKDLGYDVYEAPDGVSGLSLFRQIQPHLVFLDLNLPDMDGYEVFEHIRREDPDMPVIILTEYGEKPGRTWGDRFIHKRSLPKQNELSEMMEQLIEPLKRRRENQKLRRAYKDGYEEIIGNSEGIIKVLEMIEKVAPTDCTVLILGESGTGKELVARAIHDNSNRIEKEFVAIDCATFPEELLESELFGHERGAFTGATSLKKGLVEEANGGILFLDEIGNMKTNVQSKLLRFIQERKFRRLGGNKELQVDVRIIAATNTDLEVAVKEGAFREDLYYRLNMINIFLTPLRERTEDIPTLANHFISGKGKTFSHQAMSLMKKYNWPGNIRELRNLVERLVILVNQQEIQDYHLLVHCPEIQNSIETTDVTQTGITLEEMERRFILKILADCDNIRTKAAEVLGISIRTLQRKLKEYGINK